MSKARLIITAVGLEGRSQAQVARDYRVSQAWVSRLVARYRVEGDAAFEPRSRRPVTRPDATPSSTVEAVLELRRHLTSAGLDAGADTISWHLEHHHRIKLSRSTIYRIIRRANLVVPEPKKKPRSSYIRFQAEQPNETWQADFTHWRLADGSDIEILTWLDDHSRYALSITAHGPVTGPATTPIDTESRVRTDRVSAGAVTLRIDGHLHHIGLGRTLDGTRIIMLIDGYDVRVIHATTGEIIRQLTINPEHRYHGTGKPVGGPSRPYGPHKNKKPEP